jgi:soluble lytic murein transglycosylase
MSPPAATASERTRRQTRGAAAARRDAARRRIARRRRVARWVIGLAVLAVAVILLMPDARKLYNSLTLPLSYQDIIREQAAAEHLDPALIAAVIDAETKFVPSTSPTGAVGLMQIEPATAQFLARRSGGYKFRVSDLGTPAVNIAYGSYYLRYLLNQYKGNVSEAIAAYNGGATNVNRWVAAAQAAGHPFSLTDIRFPETAAYVAKVLEAQREYRATYRTELGYR